MLEIGVGTGRIAAPLAVAGLRMVGVDLSRPMLARLGDKRTAVLPVVGDAAAPPFRAGCVDAALLVHVLHLVPDARQVLRAAGRTVRPGGALLLGRIEYAASWVRTFTDLMWRHVEELGGPSRPADWNAESIVALADVAREARASVEERVLARWNDTWTGRGLLEALAARVSSPTWVIPEAIMPTLLARLEPAVRAALDDIDRPMTTDTSFVLSVARLPHAGG